MSFLRHLVLSMVLAIGLGVHLQAQNSDLVEQLKEVGLTTGDAMTLQDAILDFKRVFEQSGVLAIVSEEKMYFNIYQCHQANQILDRYEPVKQTLQKVGVSEKKLLEAKIIHFQRVHQYVEKTEQRLKETEVHRTEELDNRIKEYKIKFPEQTDFWAAYQDAVDESVKMSSREFHKSKDDRIFVEKARKILKIYNGDKENIDKMLDSITEGHHGKAIKLQLISWKHDQRIKGSAGK